MYYLLLVRKRGLFGEYSALTALMSSESNDSNHLYWLMSRSLPRLIPGHEKVCNPDLINAPCYKQLFVLVFFVVALFRYLSINPYALMQLSQSESYVNYAEARIIKPAATHRNGRNPPHSRLPLWLSRRGPRAGRSAETAQHRAVLLWAEI